jgi:hypothetical protein
MDLIFQTVPASSAYGSILSTKQSVLTPMEVDTTSIPLENAVAQKQSIHEATLDMIHELIHANGVDTTFPRLARLLFEPAIAMPACESTPSLPAASQPSAESLDAEEAMSRAEAAWKYFQRWKLDLEEEIQAAEAMRNYTDVNQRIIARFWEMAKSSAVGSATSADEADAASAMRFMVFAAARIKAIISLLGSGQVVSPYDTLFGDVTQEDIATAFKKAQQASREDLTRAMQADLPSISSWITLPTDAVSVRAFYLGLVTHRTPKIDPISSPLHAAISNVATKREYLEAAEQKDLLRWQVYMASLMSVRDTMKMFAT